MNWRFPLQAIVLAGLLMIPIFAWTGFYEPLPLKQLALDHPDKWASAAAGTTAAILLAAPLLWVLSPSFL